MRNAPHTLLLTGLLGALVAGGVRAQEGPPGAEQGIAAIQSQIAAIEAASGLEDATRTTLLSTYGEALTFLRKADEHRARARALLATAADAPARLERIREELAIPAVEGAVVPQEGATLPQLVQEQAHAEAAQAAARDHAEQLRGESERRTQRAEILTETIARTQQALATLNDRLKAPAPAEQDPAISAAKQTLLQSQRQALRREIEAAQAELESYTARAELLQAERDLALRDASVAEEISRAWQQITQQRRREEAEEAERNAREAEERLRREAAQRAPLVLALARGNQERAALRAGDAGLTAQLDTTGAELEQARRDLTYLRETFRIIRRKAAVAGVTDAMGMLLRKHLEELPDADGLSRRSALRQERIAELQYQLIAHEEDRLEAGDIERELDVLFATTPPQDRERLEDVARELLVARRDLLDSLIRDSTLLFNQLIELEQTTAQLIDGERETRGFIEERILWVRSVPGSPWPDATAASEAMLWLTTDAKWSQALGLTGTELQRRWPEALVWLLLLGALLALHPWSRRRIEAIANSIWRPSEDRFALTLQVLILTTLRAMTFAALLFACGWWLKRPAAQVKVALSLGAGLEAAAIVLVALTAMGHVLKPKGLGPVHFRWRSSSTRYLRRHLRWFIPSATLATVVIAAMDASAPAWNASLGRLAFAGGVIALAAFTQRVLRPDGPVVASYLQRHKKGWLARLRYLWYPLAVGLPIVLGLLALRGYYYSASRLMGRLQDSLWLVLCLILLNAILIRWLRLARSRVIHQQIEAEAAAADAAANNLSPGAVATPPGVDSAELPALAASGNAVASATRTARVGTRGFEDENPSVSLLLERIDHAAISSQTQRLFGSAIAVAAMLGFYAVWADVLPALKRLDQIHIYPTIQYVEDTKQPQRFSLDEPYAQAPPAATEGAPTEGVTPPPPKLTPAGALPSLTTPPSADADSIQVVTLADLGFSLLVFAFTLIAAQNLPGLVEYLLLERFEIDAGTRYAVSTVARYVIVLVGVTIGFGAVGFRWDSVQWLAAALTFGLAFGLQEIFANFVSGLIILFERPIRLGDWVTVNDTTGVVTRILIRSTTITDRDCKELIVPNKEFVTGNVINWALTNSVLRLQLPVGVAYGSDTARVRSLLLSVARNHPAVRDDPPPEAFFTAFGDSCLQFVLHAFIDHPIHMNEMRHQILAGIQYALGEAGIEISYPQRDLHLRTAAPGLFQSLAHYAPAPAPAGDFADEIAVPSFGAEKPAPTDDPKQA